MEKSNFSISLKKQQLIWKSDPNFNTLSRPLETPSKFEWNTAEGLVIQGKELMDQKMFAEAEVKLQEALTKDPYHLHGLVKLAELYIRNGEDKKAFEISKIHSEYGMTELLSQAYSKGNGIFECPAWMRILIRETNDPFTLAETGRTGGVNIIDLANINSCSFIATQDLGKLHVNNQFEILGRFDDAALRGCNLLVD